MSVRHPEGPWKYPKIYVHLVSYTCVVFVLYTTVTKFNSNKMSLNCILTVQKSTFNWFTMMAHITTSVLYSEVMLCIYA